MKEIANYLLKAGIVLLIVITSISCIKQSSKVCPPSYQAIVTVKDKNYSNIANIPNLTPKEEQLPFKQYVPNLSYRIFKTVSGDLVNTVSGLTIQHNNQTHELDLASLQAGSYIFNLQGNSTIPTGKNTTLSTYALHPSGQEGDDLYIFHDTIQFSPESQIAILPLIRTKGALWIQIENLPDTVVKAEETIQHIYAKIDENLTYSEETSVVKEFSTDLHPTTSLLTLLAPSYIGKTSVLRIALYLKNTTTPYMFIPDIPLTIKRNEITAFKFNFKLEGGIEFWITANGSWSKLHDLNLIPNE